MEKMDAATAMELLDAESRVWDHCLGYINGMTVQCAVEMEIADVIQSHGQPISLRDLAPALKIPPAKALFLSRLMRMLVHLGYFVQIKTPKEADGEGDQGRYWMTTLSRLLLKDNPFTARPLAICMNHPHMVDPWRRMSAWLRSNQHEAPPPPPFAFAHGGKKLYEVCFEDAPFGRMFAQSMAGDSWLFSRALVGKCREAFQGLNTLVDVGGGTGTTAKVISETFPGIRCTVFDLPHVVAAAAASEEEHPNNIDYVGGDMFSEDIPRADAVLFKWVLIDWGDECCLKVLRKCKEMLNDGGKVMIADHVLGHESCNDGNSMGTSLLVDMLDMACHEGYLRTEKQWAELFLEAGFKNYTITLVGGLRVLIEVYP